MEKLDQVRGSASHLPVSGDGASRGRGSVSVMNGRRCGRPSNRSNRKIIKLGLNGRVAIVTGAGGGIGYSTVVRLAEEGAKAVCVVLSPRAVDEVERDRRERGLDETAGVLDVGDETAVREAVDGIARDHGAVHVPVNAHGVYHKGADGVGPIDADRVADWELMLNLNLMGVVHMARNVLPGMKKQRYGGIVTLSSAAVTAGGFPEGPANELLSQADLVLGFGSSLGNQTTEAGSLFYFDRVVRIGVDATEFVADGARRRELVADARRAAHALRLACVGDRVESGVRLEAATAAFSARCAARRSRAAASGVFVASALARAVDSTAPIVRNVVVDLGYFTPEACEYVRVDSPGKFLYPDNFGSIGLALPTAAGASVADPTVSTLALVGDGGLMMSIGELETIARHELPVVVVVFYDRELGVECHALRLRNGDPGFATFRDVDFAAVARGFGIDAVTGMSVEEIDEIGLQANRWASPLLIDAKIDGTVETEWLHGIVEAGWHRRREV